MSSVFKLASSFNQDISNWDVDNVTRMDYMFRGTSNFNQDISSWNIDNVTNMDNMFQNANGLSTRGKCALHNAFKSNSNWDYNWTSGCGGWQPQNKAELQTAVDLWASDNIFFYVWSKT